MREADEDVLIPEIQMKRELIRKMREEKAPEDEIERETEKLESMMIREFLADFGNESSDVREEGPVLLTTNAVRGSEVLPELREMTRQLRRENVLR